MGDKLKPVFHEAKFVAQAHFSILLFSDGVNKKEFYCFALVFSTQSKKYGMKTISFFCWAGDFFQPTWCIIDITAHVHQQKKSSSAINSARWKTGLSVTFRYQHISKDSFESFYGLRLGNNKILFYIVSRAV